MRWLLITDEAVVDEVADEVVHPNVVITDVVVVDLVPSASANTEVMTPLTKLSVHTDGGFPGGPID